MQIAPEKGGAIQKIDLGHLEGGQQAFLVDLAGEDVTAEIADGGAKPQFGLAGRAGLPPALAGRGLVLFEVDLLLERTMAERRAREIQHDAVGLDDAGEAFVDCPI
ncbi:hypothetical protein KUV61_11025 [Nocardioides marinus]|nr:hypothetical protein [Nocardioides marinus]